MNYTITFDQIIKLFRAGGGQFSFAQPGKRVFNIKLHRTHLSALKSYVYVCFTRPGERKFFNWIKIGQYDFRNNHFYLKSEIYLAPHRLEALLKTFDIVLAHINTATLFKAETVFFYNAHCCRCGKVLDNPESVKEGLGPECVELYKEEFKNWQLNLNLP